MSVQVASTPTVARSASKERVAYLGQLLSARSPLDPALSDRFSCLATLRQQAETCLASRAIPSTREEDWRFTDLSPLLATEFQAATTLPAVTADQLNAFAISESSSRLVFINGQYSASLSHLPESSPVTIAPLSTLGNDADWESRLTRYLAQQPGEEKVFTALNTAGFSDVAVIRVSRNAIVAEPVHLLYLSTAAEVPVFYQPRCLVIAESNSALTLVEEYAALEAGTSFCNAVTEIWVEDNAQVDHVRIQQDAQSAFHIGTTAVTQARDARYHNTSISLGSQISRHDLEVNHAGEQVETTLSGLTAIGGHQLADTHSAIAYTHPHSTSNQVHKCIIDGKAHAVFNGKVSVPQAAQLTNAAQLNRNLLLSPRARVDTKPQLEIVADNVKCTHGATVGQLSTDEVFYLQSRGIDTEMARRLLVQAFAYEVLDQIPVPSVKARLVQQAIELVS